MINIVRIGTFLLAAIVLTASVFFVDADHELDMAYRAYRHFDMDQAMRHARRAVWSAGDKKHIALKALGLEWKIAATLHREAYTLEALNRMIRLSPDCATCYLQRGDFFYARASYQKAVDDLSRGFQQAGTLTDKKRAYFHTRRGLAWLELGNEDKARTDVVVALEMDPDSPLAHFLKSKLLRALGDGTGAIQEAHIGYRLGNQKKGFFSSPEGEGWLKYYSLVLLHR